MYQEMQNMIEKMLKIVTQNVKNEQNKECMHPW
jgi:hypothetical protein